MTYRKVARVHKKLHTNEHFYSLTPQLAPATAWALNIAVSDGLSGKAYYEFGIFKGFNLWFAEHYLRPFLGGKDFRFYGFDSFEGMPPNSVDPNWNGGNYCAKESEVMTHLYVNGATLDKIELIKGWFCEGWVNGLRELHPFEPVAVAVIDSDLYESCVPVLKFLYPLLRKGSVVLFDDWNAYDCDDDKGERRALAEFMEEHKSIKIQYLFDFGKYGKSTRITEI